MTSASRAFEELYPAVYRALCRRWSAGEYRPSPEATAILEHLAGSGPLTVSEAAQHFDRSQAATSELLDRLEGRELISRMVDERDARRHLVWLTKTGLEVCERLKQVLDGDRLAAAFEVMETEEQRALLDGMRALLAATRTLKPTPKTEEES